MCVYVCVCVRARAQVCVCVWACARRCVYMRVCCSGDANGCIPLTMLVGLCQCCRLLMFLGLPLFETLSLL